MLRARIEYRVVKNTLLQKALEQLDTDYVHFDDSVLKVFWNYVLMRILMLQQRLIKEFRKTGVEKPILKGASIDRDFIYGEENSGYAK